MINVITFIDALKFTWIRRLLLTDRNWKLFIKLKGCNTKYLPEIITGLPNKFWKDVLQSCTNIIGKTTDTDEDILRSLISYNGNIRIGGPYLFYKSWFEKGVKYIYGLINENGDVYSYADLILETGIKINSTQYYVIFKAVKPIFET